MHRTLATALPLALALTLGACSFEDVPSEQTPDGQTTDPDGQTTDPNGHSTDVPEVDMDAYEGPSFSACTGGKSFATGGDAAGYYTVDAVDGPFLHHAWVDYAADPTLWLDIEIYQDWGGFASFGSPYYFWNAEESYSNCDLCVVAYTDDAVFMPVKGWGVAQIDSISLDTSAVDQTFSGTLDVVLQEVTMDASYNTQVVEGGCQGRLTYSWGSQVSARQPYQCTQESADSDSLLACAPCMGQGGVYQCYGERDGQDGDVVYFSWVDQLMDPARWLDIEVYADGGPTSPKTYQFSSDDESYQDCSVCVVAWTWDEIHGDRAFMPVGKTGYAEIDAVAVGEGVQGERFAGTLDVQMQEVTINTTNWATQVVPGGCTGRLVYSWDATIADPGDYVWIE